MIVQVTLQGGLREYLNGSFLLGTESLGLSNLSLIRELLPEIIDRLPKSHLELLGLSIGCILHNIILLSLLIVGLIT